MNSESYRERDVRHLWHPYSDIADIEGEPFPVIQRGEGIYLIDADGNKLIDAISSWWGCNLGHSHPQLIAALSDQAHLLQHSILGGMSHPKAVELAERLAEVSPALLTRVMFASDGASAVEAALKIAVLYWAHRGETGRTEFASLADAYHGDTLGAIGVGFIPGFHEQFASLVPSAHRAASPYCYRCPANKQPDSCRCECFESMEHLVAEHGKRLAAIIVEPLCQAAAGMRIYPAEYLRRLRALCDAEGLLLIADEIATGFGRVGEMFACDRAGISPDIMCVGKALTGGYLAMSATLVTEGIYDAFRPVGGRARTFYHGHTFCGNPLAAAVACASLDVYRTEGIIERTVPLARRLAEGMGEMSSLEPVADVRCLGMIGALEFSSASGASAFARRACAEARKRGALLRPLGGVIYLWPPLTISADELDTLISIMHESVASAAKTKGTLH